jgi:DNA polymerase-4
MRAHPVILHLDLDAFFSAVEQLHKPSLRGKPIIVGGTGRRGVVATASYETRAYGVGSAMPIAQARRLCPNAAYLAPRFATYQTISAVVMELLRDLSPLLEQVSVDEAYLDLTPTHPRPSLTEITEITEITESLRARVQEVTGLTASVGVGTSKLIAKVSSELTKPNGLTVIPPSEEASALAPLPVGRLPRVGPATREVLRKHRITTVRELGAADVADIVTLLGQAHGTTLYQYAQGVDHRAVKIRHFDFATLTRSTALDQPTESSSVFLTEARRLLAPVDPSNGIRLLGFSVSGLRDYAQTDLLADLLPVSLAHIDVSSSNDSLSPYGSRGPTPRQAG